MKATDINHATPDLDLARALASLDDDLSEAAQNEILRRKAGKDGPHQSLPAKREESEP